MSAKNQCCIWDFTQHDLEEWGVEETIAWCKEHCKMWCFQLERGAKTGKLHLQGKISLWTKKYKLIGEMGECHWSPSHDVKFTYVTKEETRVDGPWDSKSTVEYVPTHIRKIKPYKWQQEVLDSAGLVEREINVIIDEEGCKGKTILASLARAKGYVTVPPIGDAERLISTTCDILMGKRCREPNLIIFDIPRSVDKRRLNHLFITIETIKSGWVYDTRNRYKEWVFDPPALWVLTNHDIPIHYMSKDTWKIWKILDNKLCSMALGHPAARGCVYEETKFDWECQELLGNYIVNYTDCTNIGATL